MTNLAIILGRTCRSRKAETMARWAHDKAHSRQDAEFELIDVAGFDLPLLDEELPPATGQLRTLYVKAWAAKIESFDRFVFVTPEYNQGISGARKNTIDLA